MISAVHEHAHELTLGLAFFLAAIQTFEPGHGKTAMLVYPSGDKGETEGLRLQASSST